MDRVHSDQSDQLANKSTGEPASAEVLGVRVDCLTMAEAVDCCMRFLKTAGHHQVVTVNPEFVMLAQHDAPFRSAIRNASLVVPDGAGIVWAMRRQGFVDAERVTGIDLMQALCVRAAQEQVPVFLLGAAPGIAVKAAAILQQEIPDLTVAGTAVGSPDPKHAAGLCAQIRESGAGILFVAFGCPAQDFWIQQYQEETGARLAIGVGGSFDYISGAVTRAPLWVRGMNLEWCYRLFRQPWRWRRQLTLIPYVWKILREKPRH
ncbi:MAG: WecB/TagA/CpsF family glycosyltransferase [Chloroflexota bacterium]|nr:WecB/TagA/CpsF family glycosyltransferase [Chloroflexota bacterium]MDE2840075.1 WecB/TagA/CpsF family glycosyltransferase [Chloroflexota bacterium]MDE2930845.1 WecB/TagA/CpsF family glycosyltransferase [Chloroflexota bacterium]